MGQSGLPEVHWKRPAVGRSRLMLLVAMHIWRRTLAGDSAGKSSWPRDKDIVQFMLDKIYLSVRAFYDKRWCSKN